MLKIRLRRMGSRHKPFYRVVVSDSRKVPTGAALEEIGYYDPRRRPTLLEIDTQRVDHWVGNGAQLSPTVANLVEKAKEAAAAADAAAPEESKAAKNGSDAAASKPAEEKAAKDESTDKEAAAAADEAASETSAEAETAAESEATAG